MEIVKERVVHVEDATSAERASYVLPKVPLCKQGHALRTYSTPFDGFSCSECQKEFPGKTMVGYGFQFHPSFCGFHTLLH